MPSSPSSPPASPGFGDRLYRHRGWIAVPPAVVAVVLADPRPGIWPLGLGLMILGEGIRLWGAAHLGRTARSSRPRAGKLVTHGPYARTRHPLYWGNLTLVLGFSLVSGALLPWLPLVLVPGAAVLYRRHALREEAVLRAERPEVWDGYASRVPRWRWRLRPARIPGWGSAQAPSFARALRVEALTLHAEAWLLFLVWMRTRI